ncbi:unnamed protein product [Adineta ricciae]|uniref:Uncharacterized protein n=1 Tax=Adineta ricciae TaxID=249248 RepID=A0A813YW07_ADIRI|nr:unnamed protein product [Adineta ricciae]CAF1261194.1 unnamed protein product [Adineta ricciae]
MNHQDQSHSNEIHSCRPIPPRPATITRIIPSSMLRPIVPHERQIRVCSVKVTMANESIGQRTQYLETIPRIPQQQQRSFINSSTVHQIRFANHQSVSTTEPHGNSVNLRNSSLHLVNNVVGDDDICAIDQVLSIHDQQSPSLSPTINTDKANVQTNNEKTPFSAFLIDNCDEEEPPKRSSPPQFPLSDCSIATKVVQSFDDSNENEQCGSLMSEFNAGDAEQEKILHRRKEFYQRLRKQIKLVKQSKGTVCESQSDQNRIKTTANNNTTAHHESPSEWVVEYKNSDMKRLPQSTVTLKKTATIGTMTDDYETNEINTIIEQVKNQQLELNQLRKSLIAMLNAKQSDNVNSNHDHLLKLLDQPILSGCWLCSGKSYTEVAAQCNSTES